MSALDDVQTAQAELHASSYWKPGSRGWTTTHLYRCDVALQAAVADLAAPAPPPVPPPAGAFFVADFSTGDFSQWAPGHLDDIGAATVVASPAPPGFSHSMKCVNAAGSPSTDGAVVERGDTLPDYQLPWLVAGAKVWHRLLALFPDGADPRYPGKFTVAPLGGWNAICEWHNRTDAQMNMPSPAGGGYLSTYVGVHNNGDGTGSLVFRTAGGTPQAPVLNENNLRNLKGANLLFNHWYELLVYMEYQPDASGYAEWWVDGALVWSGRVPTVYRMADGSSGQRFQVGHYRGVAPLGYTDTLYLGGVVVGPSRASVGG